MDAVLLVNLGTPDEPTPKAVRRFLKEFLSDRRVIQMPPALWQPILRLMVLPARGPYSANMYKQVWTENGSPIKQYTQRQAEAIAQAMPDFMVRYAFSYSAPRLEDVLDELTAKHVENLTIVPLYPQYSTTTVASVLDTVHRYYMKATNMPNLHMVSSFCRRADYLDALAASIQRQLEAMPTPPDRLLFSYHGIPQSYEDQGDIYRAECEATTEGVMERLRTNAPTLGAIDHQNTFQSKFGPAPWITPATIDTVSELAKQGVRNLAIVTPSFVSDCLETIYEIGQYNAEAFTKAGGERLTLIHPLNDDPAFTRMLANLINENSARPVPNN